VTIANPKKPTT